MRMALAADAAAYEKIRRVAAARQSAGAGTVEAEAEAGPSGAALPRGTTTMPSASFGGISASRGGGSVMPGPTASSVTAGTAVAGASMSCRAQLGANLEALQLHAADEATMPLLVAHCILSEVSMRCALGLILISGVYRRGCRAEGGAGYPVSPYLSARLVSVINLCVTVNKALWMRVCFTAS